MSPRPVLLVGLLTATLFVWAGMVGAISFLEAPLKFTAPHITVALGVGIGRVVFHALNQVEFALCFVALGCAGALRVPTDVWRGLVTVTLVLVAQTLWLLPALDARAALLLAGRPAGPSYHHVAYIVAEGSKLAALLLTGLAALRLAVRAPLPPTWREYRRTRPLAHAGR